MAIPTAAISGVVTIAILSWLFRLARKPVPVLPDGSLLVRYGKWMIVVGVACGVLMPLALLTVAVTAGFRNPGDPYYFGGMLLFFALLGWWALLEGLKRRVVATDSGLVAHSPWRGEPRSEEHTSELQSRSDLVCRLLLEKKKNNREKECD